MLNSMSAMTRPCNGGSKTSMMVRGGTQQPRFGQHLGRQRGKQVVFDRRQIGVGDQSLAVAAGRGAGTFWVNLNSQAPLSRQVTRRKRRRVPGRYRSVIRRLSVTADGEGGPANRKRLSRSTLAYLPSRMGSSGGVPPAQSCEPSVLRDPRDFKHCSASAANESEDSDVIGR